MSSAVARSATPLLLLATLPLASTQALQSVPPTSGWSSPTSVWCTDIGYEEVNETACQAEASLAGAQWKGSSAAGTGRPRACFQETNAPYAYAFNTGTNVSTAGLCGIADSVTGNSFQCACAGCGFDGPGTQQVVLGGENESCTSACSSVGGSCAPPQAGPTTSACMDSLAAEQGVTCGAQHEVGSTTASGTAPFLYSWELRPASSERLAARTHLHVRRI